MTGVPAKETLRRRRGKSDHSYKFQRLREKIRQAVASGELSGKLPGERELARRFQVNAKTLSKALTDLAGEGLLSRSIGRGTFVKGTEMTSRDTGMWLVVCDNTTAEPALAEALRAANPNIEFTRDVTSPRPSFINQFSAVIDLSSRTPETFVRDMLVRNMPLVVVGREPATYSTNAVLMDIPYLAGRLGRELLLGGHRRLATVSIHSQSESCPVATALRAAACRYAPDATVSTALASTALNIIEDGVTGLVCDSTEAAKQVISAFSEAGIAVPKVVSVAAIGQAEAEQPCSGFYLAAGQEVESIVHLLQHGRSGGGTVLWLTGKYVDKATIGSASTPAEAGPPQLSLTA